jgi:hypothetical protein
MLFSRGASATRSASLLAIPGFITVIRSSLPSYESLASGREAGIANAGVPATSAGLAPNSANIFRRSIAFASFN